MTSKLIRYATITFFGLVAATASMNASAGWVGQLNGTWNLTGTPDPNVCDAPAFVNLATITVDGKIINVDPGLGAGVGEAYRLGRRTYAVGFFGFIPSPQGLLRYEVQGTARLQDSSHFTGRFRTILFDPANNPFCEYEGSIEGFRLVPMPY